MPVEIVDDRYIENAKAVFFSRIKKYNAEGDTGHYGRTVLLDDDHIMSIKWNGRWSYSIHPIESMNDAERKMMDHGG